MPNYGRARSRDQIAVESNGGFRLFDSAPIICLYTYSLSMRGASRGDPEVGQPNGPALEIRRRSLGPSRGNPASVARRPRAGFAGRRSGGPGQAVRRHYDRLPSMAGRDGNEGGGSRPDRGPTRAPLPPGSTAPGTEIAASGAPRGERVDRKTRRRREASNQGAPGGAPSPRLRARVAKAPCRRGRTTASPGPPRIRALTHARRGAKKFARFVRFRASARQPHFLLAGKN